MDAEDEKRRAVSRLAVLHHAPIFGYCRRRLGTDAEADDALQETFMRAFKYWHSYDPAREARKWLFGIAHNVCVEIARGRKRHLTVAGAPEAVEERSVTEAALDRLSAQENVERVRRELERLPDRARRILELRFFAHMTSAEIAALEDMTETAVRVALHRALEGLRDKLAR